MSGYYKLRVHPEYELFKLLMKLTEGTDEHFLNGLHSFTLRKTGGVVRISPQWIRETT